MDTAAAPSNDRPVLTVTQLNHQARITVEQQFNMVWVTGELSNFARPRSGHWYFTLKDDGAQVRCAMFVNRNRHARIQPGDGQQVVVRGRVSIYEGRGDFQIIVDQMEPAGEGALRQAYDALKLKLDQEGLFAIERKRDLPRFPRHVGIISSPTGAALHDMLAVWRRRYPALHVTLIPSDVQGAQAEPHLLSAFDRIKEIDPDLVIVTRGGGSLEDLWAFNLESVARAIAACPIPTICAVGHEIDVTIADFVADVRAPTPSAAAELTVPDRQELEAVLAAYVRDFYGAWQRYHELSHIKLSHFRRALVSPQTAIEQAYQRTDDAASRVQLAGHHHLLRLRERVRALRDQLRTLGPTQRVAHMKSQVSSHAARLTMTTNRRLAEQRQRVANAARLLTNVSPLPTLARGYAVVREAADGPVIMSTEQIHSGQSVVTHLADGAFTATVDKVDKNAILENPSE